MSTPAETLTEPNSGQRLGVWFKILRADGTIDGTIETALQIANHALKTGIQARAVWGRTHSVRCRV